MGDCDEGEVDFVSGGAPYDGHDKCRERIQELEAEIARLRADNERLRETLAQERVACVSRTALDAERAEVARLRGMLEVAAERAEDLELRLRQTRHTCECSEDEACAHVRRAEKSEAEVERLRETEKVLRGGLANLVADNQAAHEAEVSGLRVEIARLRAALDAGKGE